MGSLGMMEVHRSIQWPLCHAALRTSSARDYVWHRTRHNGYCSLTTDTIFLGFQSPVHDIDIWPNHHFVGHRLQCWPLCQPWVCGCVCMWSLARSLHAISRPCLLLHRRGLSCYVQLPVYQSLQSPVSVVVMCSLSLKTSADWLAQKVHIGMCIVANCPDFGRIQQEPASPWLQPHWAP
jgi:hypothetical protein